MRLPREGHLLRIFVGEADRHEGRPLYEWIVLRARERGLAGATVLRGVEGFGAKSQLHKASILRLSQDLPVVIEIVDERPKLEALLEELDPAIEGGLATLEKAEVLLFRSGG